ncbi:MAG: hypothetical protein JSR46_05360 [Verrucomicrobia bacterium]|nr:hypothetical protein [Verrucomicrobiota bacterium]
MDGPFAGSFDESITLVVHTTADERRQYALRYQPPGNRSYTGWEIEARLKNKKGIMLSQSLYLSGPTEEGIVQTPGGMGAWVRDTTFKNELLENMKQFLIHILHHSPKLRGVQFESPKVAELYRFEGQLVSKESYAQPDGYDLVPPFSLDFITQVRLEDSGV